MAKLIKNQFRISSISFTSSSPKGLFESMNDPASFRFPLLQPLYLFLYRITRDISVDKYSLFLSDTVSPAQGLYLRGWVPPWVENEDIISLCQVEPHTSRLERDEEDLDAVIVSETVDHALSRRGWSLSAWRTRYRSFPASRGKDRGASQRRRRSVSCVLQIPHSQYCMSPYQTCLILRCNSRRSGVG